jgi:hypothetical protein
VKISHRDFRPPRRSKYVTQPLKRRPTLRILLLAAIGIAVYFKFDSIVSSKPVRKLSGPGSPFAGLLRMNRGPAESAPVPEGAAPAAGLRWSADSSILEAVCEAPRANPCLERWHGLGEEVLGSLRATLAKAGDQWDLRAESGFTAEFRRDSAQDLAGRAECALALERLELRNPHGTVEIKPGPGGMCAKERCLDELRPQAPFARFRHAGPATARGDSRTPEATFFPVDGAFAAKPILQGRIVRLPSDSSGGWLEVYHGGTLFSYYHGLASLKPGLAAGSMVGPEDTLGMMAADSDTSSGLDVKIEKDGLMVDPIGFIGLTAEPTLAGTHAR